MQNAMQRASRIEDGLANQVDRKRGPLQNGETDYSSSRKSKLVFRGGRYVEATQVVTTPKPACITSPKTVTIVLELPVTKTEPEPETKTSG